MSKLKANPLHQLAEIAVAWQTRPIPEATAWATRRAVLDWFATMLPGCPLEPATMLVPALRYEQSMGEAICYITGGKMSPRKAAFLNAVASHTVEFDDIFKDGGYHPGSPTIAAALAMAQHLGTSVDSFHRAVIAGYEVGCRVSLAIQPSHYRFWHITATVGTIGAAVAGAMLLGCNETQMRHAIGLASSFAGGHQQNLMDDSMAKALHPGHAADAGLLGAMAAAEGVTASPSSLDGEKGFAAATSDSAGNWSAAFEGLGEWTPITRMTVKAHGCCGHIFPALDGLKLLQQRMGFHVADIASIHVEGYAPTFQMCNRPDAQSVQDARFSLQYCLAVQLVLGAVRLEAFSPAALANETIRTIMPKITVSEDADIAAAYPRRRMARIDVQLNDGRRETHFQQTRKGDPEDPLSDAELISKFEELAGSAVEPEHLNILLQSILHGHELPGAAPLKA